jgi:hypothetical protein
MAESPELLMLEFLSWVADHRRTYDEAMEAWQSHCPRQTIWEDAIIEGLVQINKQSNDHEVTLTPRAEAILRDRRSLLCTSQ